MKSAFIILGAAGALLIAAPAATAQLVITEIWQGVSGPDHTTDWFEVTNFGAAAFDATSLYFDDDSNDPLSAVQLFGIASIGAGESVIFVEGGHVAVTQFMNVWGVAGVQIGWHDGPGFGQGGDAAYLYDSNTADANLIAGQVFGATDGGQSWFWNPSTMSWNDELSIAGQYGAFESSFTQEIGYPAVGSPGVIPAPSTLGMLALAGVAGLRRRSM